MSGRPYGLEGEPAVWSGRARYISFKKLPYNEVTFERVREAVKARVGGGRLILTGGELGGNARGQSGASGSQGETAGHSSGDGSGRDRAQLAGLRPRGDVGETRPRGYGAFAAGGRDRGAAVGDRAQRQGRGPLIFK